MSTDNHSLAILAAISNAIGERRYAHAQSLFDPLPDSLKAVPEGLRLAGQLAWATGDYDRALRSFEHACELAPRDPDCQLALARALTGLGDIKRAVAGLDRFIAQSGHQAGLLPMLELLRFDDRDPRPSLRRLEASGTPASDPHAYLHWRALRVLAGLEAAAAMSLPHPRAQAIWDFFLHQHQHQHRQRPPARLVGSAPQLMDIALAHAQRPGLVIECGVFHGRSLRYLAKHLTDQPLHGFDSFEGLPEDWLPGETAGSYSTRGLLPAVAANVTLHKGWFRDSLPTFVAANAGATIRLLHVDCDLYQSTVDVFAALGNQLRVGSVIVFDDYLGYPNAEQHEYRAFAEFCSARGLRFRYLAFALMGREAAVIVEDIAGS